MISQHLLLFSASFGDNSIILQMEGKFYINEDRMYSPTDRKVNGTLTLSSSIEVNDIQSITYGIKSKLQLLPHYDSDGNITHRVVSRYHYWNNTSLLTVNKKGKKRLRANPNGKEVYIVNDIIMDKSVCNDKLVRNEDGNCKFLKNETIVHNFEVEFPSPDEWFLPSTAYDGINRSNIYHFTVQIRYFVYIKVNRIGSILKREKSDEFLKDIEYQSGIEFPTQLALLPYSEDKKFKSKMPRPDLVDNQTGNSVTLASDSHKPKFLRRFLNRKEGTNVPFTMDFNVQSLLSIYQPFPDQFTLKFAFDFSSLNFLDDFGTEKSSTGLGLFQIESLRVKVQYTNSLDIESDSTVFNQRPITILEFNFKDLIFDMKNSIYDKSTKTGTLEIPQHAFTNQLNLNLPLGKLINKPIVTSCNVFDFVQNFTTLHFIWTVKDTDNSLKFTFKTDSTFSAEPDYEPVPPYLEPTPAYDDIKTDGPALAKILNM